MDLNELKSAWNKISTTEEKNRQLPVEEFQKILKKRTLDITEKVGRNIRIGIGIILGWVALGFAMDFILSPILDKQLDKPYLTQELMFWTFLLEVFIYVLIFVTIIIFWIRYNKIEKKNIDISNLKSKLTGIIQILDSYRKMFYIVLTIVLLYAVLSFSSAFILEYRYQLAEAGFDLSNLNFKKWTLLITTFLIVLGLLLSFYYLLFNLFFKRLYGRYLKKLKETLIEMEEVI